MQNEKHNSSLGVLVLGLAVAGGLLCCSRPRQAPAPTPSASAAEPHAEGAHDEELFITTLPGVPGRVVAQAKGGLYCRFFEYSGTGDYGERFRNALEGLRVEGKKLGANAFVQARISSESHEIQGSKWHSSIVHVCGDFVRVE